MRSIDSSGLFGAEMEGLIAQTHMLPPGCGVLCAVSGGADSVCLLHRLYRLRAGLGLRLTAAHYNHRLRGSESDGDEQFVREFAALCCGPDRWLEEDGTQTLLPAVPLIVGSGDVAGEAARRGTGIEETARQMRYAFLQEAARAAGADWIATAHTADDNAETVLLHLARGSGLRGLTGIQPVRGNLIRPLLTTSRGEVEAELRYHGLPFVEDSSNRDEAYARNRVRRRVVPLLEELYPGFARRMADTTALLRADESYLEGQAQSVRAEARRRGDGLTISARAVAQLPDAVATRVVRGLLAQLSGDNDNCAAAHLWAVLALCRGTDPSARASLPNGLIARREYELLVLAPAAGPPLPFEPVPLPLPGAATAGGYWVTCTPGVYGGERQTALEFDLAQTEIADLTARVRRTGDLLSRPGRPRGSVKKLLIDEKIPQLSRARLPVLDCGGRVAAVVGLGPDQSFLPRVGQPCWHIAAQPVKERGTPGIE